MTTMQASASKAGLGVRAGARTIDAALLVAAELGLGSVMGFGFDWLAIGAAGVLAYFTLANAWLGGTLGKRVLGLQVQGPDGGRPTLGQAALREVFTLFGAVPFVGPLLALAAWIGIAIGIRGSEDGRAWHDRLAGGTRVVRS